MIELLIAASLLGSQECREVSLLYDPYEVSLMTCMIAGQPEVARWQAAHSGWRVTRWSCGVQDTRSSRL